MKLTRLALNAAAMALMAHSATAGVVGATSFVNGLAIDGATQDMSTGTAVERRVGFFSDLYYDNLRKEWWGVSDRGPGGGTLSYETRVQRFTLDVAGNGAISNFQVAETVKFSSGGQALNGLAPSPAGVLGRSFDPEGMVIVPGSGNILVADEYGPSLRLFNRNGEQIRAFTPPANLVPKVGTTVDYTAAPGTAAGSLTSGREPNRGFEGLAISPDGKFAYAVLQNGTIQDGYNTATGTRGQYTRIVKFDMATGQAVAQYAYKLDSSGQGRGISSLVALGNDKFLVLERNNRGVGVGATLAGADKNVYEIDLAGAVDVSNTNLPASGNFAGAVTKVAKVLDLDANTLAALGNKSPEKWEGLAIGPQLADGSFLILAGTDNDYSVTQNSDGTQYDVFYRMSDADPFASSIQCPIGTTANCFFTANNAATNLAAGYGLLPGVLHAYTARLTDYVAPVSTPGTLALTAGTLALLLASRRRH